MTTKLFTTLLAAVASTVIVCSCAGDAGITVVAGTWSYSLEEGIPLPGPTTKSCKATATGTAAVASDGTYSIAFPSLSCSGCTMSASTTGTVSSSSINGTVTASISGSGCSAQGPTPNPAPVTGKCTSTNCSASTGDAANFAVDYTLNPPG
ncbi:MAG TPA: hypothetical protein VN706_21685 [Gemmatimonadaceae bacterium]|nr:hypothetical protein [Gemmatimonadaceae bacterium]